MLRQVLLFLLLGLISSTCLAGNLTLNWTFDASATATCQDGSPAAQNCPATAFEIQLKDANGVWNVVEAVAATARSKTYANVVAGAVRCYRLRTNSNGTYSTPSVEACATMPSVSPKAPDITVVVTVQVSTP